ncbi:hypothetical protein [Pelagicoccus sp. SDUM812003]|uniref:hypothetical protein n=1 Tax=Pelagicoccus sp. SDUM812003 TaxID=3041267 RepID=UPI0028101A03|nr:hypothetical protein [Pelagicoccus sp. SDUM812003]MDQ8201786.1 hypothetical protein [Pelagicoccus sp. SDUM812003]
MSATASYSEKLNLIFEEITGDASGEDIFENKAASVRRGWVNARTRVLAIVEANLLLDTQGMKRFSERLMKELPEYNGTRVAIVTRGVGATAGSQKVASDVSATQSVAVFSTLNNAVFFLRLDLKELLEELPAVGNWTGKYLE